MGVVGAFAAVLLVSIIALALKHFGINLVDPQPPAITASAPPISSSDLGLDSDPSDD